MEYPNKYYLELASRVNRNTSLSLLNGEVCFFEGIAHASRTTVTQTKSKPRRKLGCLWTPWFSLIKHTESTEITTTTRKNLYEGRLYVTNMRIVFDCQIDGFVVFINKIRQVKQYSNGISVFSGFKEYKVLTNRIQEVLYVIRLMNEAQNPRNNTPSDRVWGDDYQNSVNEKPTYTPAENKKLKNDLKKIIADHPGLLQTEIYKHLPEYDRSEISNILYWWEKSGKIRREKSGRTYAVFAANL